MNRKYIISLDQGTSSCRALAIDSEGRVVGMEQKEFRQIYPQNDWVEHDAQEIFETQLSVVRLLLRNHQIGAKDIVGIGITNQRETTVVWDRFTGKPIHNAIVWQDKRTLSFCSSLPQSIKDKVKLKTGLPMDPYFSATKLKWILEHHQGSQHNLLFGTIDTWLLWKMTHGKSHITDHTNACRTLLYNIHTHTWDDDLLTIFNIPSHILPQIQDSGSHFGCFQIDGSEIPIISMVGDQQSALYGQRCFEKGNIKNTYGTGCFMLMHTGDTPIQSRHGLITTVACTSEGKPAYALEGSVFVAGAAIQWLRDGLGMIDNAAQTETLAQTLVNEKSEIVFVPALSGLGAPHWQPHAKGAIFGLTRATRKEHLAKAVLQGIAFQTFEMVKAMQEDSQTLVHTLRVDGGAASNNYLMQIQADILQTPVHRPHNVESTAMGVAYLAGLQAEIWDIERLKSLNRESTIFNPTLAIDDLELMWSQWQKAVEALKTFHS